MCEQVLGCVVLVKVNDMLTCFGFSAIDSIQIYPSTVLVGIFSCVKMPPESLELLRGFTAWIHDRTSKKGVRPFETSSASSFVLKAQLETQRWKGLTALSKTVENSPQQKKSTVFISPGFFEMYVCLLLSSCSVV